MASVTDPLMISAVAEMAEEGLPELPSPYMGSRMLCEPVLKKHGSTSAQEARFDCVPTRQRSDDTLNRSLRNTSRADDGLQKTAIATTER